MSAKPKKFTEEIFIKKCFRDKGYEIRITLSIAAFELKLLSIIRPPAKPVCGIRDPLGLSYLSHLRVARSKSNFLKFEHNFKDTINSMCPTNDGI